MHPGTNNNQSATGIETVILAIAETIKEVEEIPSGHLYARVMGHMSLDQYEQIISTLVRVGLVENHNHLLRWIGQFQ